MILLKFKMCCTENDFRVLQVKEIRVPLTKRSKIDIDRNSGNNLALVSVKVDGQIFKRVYIRSIKFILDSEE